ncbi:MAG: J domain-containing protein [Oceanidesulfovibrio sp.]
MTLKDAYRLLRVHPEASLVEVKSAFRRMAFELHPDLHPDNPKASQDFQRINEAYVILKEHLEGAGGHAEHAARKRDEAKAKEQQQTTAEAWRRAEEQTAKARARQARQTASKERTVKREEVLHTILKDPFARQVFEDIYRQVRETQGKEPGKAGFEQKQAVRTAKKPKPIKRIDVEWGDSKHSVDMSEGMGTAVKRWFRGWLDEIQTVHLPPQNLRPGARLRLQIHRGLSNKTSTVEVTLPPDFSLGRPIRLRGLGRRVGGLKGDLYLKILAG